MTEVYVLAALGLSVGFTNGGRADDGGLQWDRVRRKVEERLDNGSIGTLKLCAELSSLGTVLKGRAPETTRTALVLFHESGNADQKQAVGLITYILSRIEVHGHKVRVEPVDIGYTGIALEEVIPAHQSVLREAALYVSRSEDLNTDVFINASSGPRAVTLALQQLATMFSLPVLLNADPKSPAGGRDTYAVEIDSPPLRLDPHDTLRWVDAADYAATAGGDGRTVAESLGVAPLVMDSGRGYGHVCRSSLADILERRIATARAPRIYPAGAELLRRHGRQELADRLEEHVDSWVSQRIWSLNKVPEMVLHDDRHAERVSHLVATLAEPLLGNETLTADDVFMLSCAAWLHDWGHVGFHINDDWITHPVDVRNVHGLLTQLLLEGAPRIHGLDRDLAKRVGVIAAHHQGWTSFDHVPPSVRDTVSDDNADACSRAGKVHTIQRFEGLNPRSLRDDAASARIDYNLARLLVALLRVADAADLGLHRVPGGPESLEAHRLNHMRSILSLTMQEVGSLRENGSITYATKDHLADIHKRVLSADASLQTAITDLASLLNDLENSPTLVLSEDERFVKRLISYLCQVKKQGEFDDNHAQVLTVRFEMSPKSDRWSYQPKVTPAHGVGLDTAQKIVASDIERELGLKNSTDGNAVNRVLQSAGLYYSPPQNF